METWLWWIIVGGLAGWLAGTLIKGGGFGIVVNVLLGIVGSVIGAMIVLWLYNKLNKSA